MKNIDNYIQEKLVINKHTKINIGLPDYKVDYVFDNDNQFKEFCKDNPDLLDFDLCGLKKINYPIYIYLFPNGDKNKEQEFCDASERCRKKHEVNTIDLHIDSDQNEKFKALYMYNEEKGFYEIFFINLKKAIRTVSLFWFT